MPGSGHTSSKLDSHKPLLLALSLVLFSAHACGQTQLATVFGTIADSTGAVIAGAQVTVASISTGLKRVGLTDIKGEYHVAGLPPGMYTVRVNKGEALA